MHPKNLCGNNILTIDNYISREILYSEILEKWLFSTKYKVRESTYMRYKNLVKNHIMPILGKLKIVDIDITTLEKYINYKLEHGRMDKEGGLSPKTVSDIVFIIKASIKYASYYGYKINYSLDSLYVKRSDREMRVLSLDEQRILTSYLLKDINLTKLGILLSLYTGIRLGEVCALKWKSVNLDEKVLKISSTMQRIPNDSSISNKKTRIIIGKPKSQSSVRDIPLPEFLVTILKRYSFEPEQFILTGKINEFVEPRVMQNRFKSYIKALGITKANYHTLRHTFATRCVEAEFDIKILSEILGHSNISVTLNRYVHTSLEMKSKNMNKLNLIL